MTICVPSTFTLISRHYPAFGGQPVRPRIQHRHFGHPRRWHARWRPETALPRPPKNLPLAVCCSGYFGAATKSWRESRTYRGPPPSISHAPICRSQGSDMHSDTQRLRRIPLPFLITEAAHHTVHQLTLGISGFHLPHGRCESVRCPEARRGWLMGWDVAKASPDAV